MAALAMLAAAPFAPVNELNADGKEARREMLTRARQFRASGSTNISFVPPPDEHLRRDQC
jgi:hypothetical protein